MRETLLEHGGNLHDAVGNFGRPLEQWLDLSTGINPHYYPVPPLAADVWHRLPETSKALLDAACACYRAPRMLAVAGSQAAIQALPRLRAIARVVVAAPSYAEHAHQWRCAGHAVSEIAYSELEAAIDQADVVVLCNPNNPTGASVAPAQLLAWAARLAQRGGWLVVDEAFGDTMPALSVCPHSGVAGLIVLRSVGKFFGLAGIRVGFVAAEAKLLHRLAAWLGPWTLNGPAQQIACAALSDRVWQSEMRQTLADAGQGLRALLHAHGFASSGTDLFQWVSDRDLAGRTELLWRFMAERGIWLRWFAAGAQRPHGLRFGLPGTAAGWERLSLALNEWSQHAH
ncbi:MULTISPECIES: threonine-phosphate decarboxylase CobD [unclassified Undibacterium]|uniref:threonine-phosphate decarboxylase CobD n=1 Tax=unclassified Undibacterium TaxID=2630295 RepID=UPI002AC9B298|nr:MULTISPECIES: threonine-phosphate decarboxylase CobD [unclassified Undibacterium]MEB0139078.1 threonine-phosphate decarboxylase CobD [Undibacterium sp. CCC2.1]MEB0172965.1 threonine-phosphate decarboxylase CobD [Undibacterium sp. CCC1.1]MEB0177287.1 threonine-phosphate decarboxylase CobD [Undibacterium sp. CCC3.4]MEB0215883.1 threonine-phosphate decarboxylase CobD [Undibacterium sp. 5I2]WPX42085.1 threonine-phosphate decarboxylase CobD [Undibacterium sp. CCC3.4]